MLATAQRTVRDIALEEPSSIRVFESFGIDYCCGGKRTLGEACAAAGVSPDAIQARLDDARRNTAQPDDFEWHKRPLHELISHIVSIHHSYVRRETPRIENLLRKVSAGHGEAHPEVAEIEKLFSALAGELRAHMAKEEQILFPSIGHMEMAPSGAASASGGLHRPIERMLDDHDDAGALLSRIRSLTNNYHTPNGACPTFVALYSALREFESDLHLHVHLENNILFPRAIGLAPSEREAQSELKTTRVADGSHLPESG